MNVNLQLSRTPEDGKFWQGYRSRWVDPFLPDLCQGDIVMLHVSCGHVPNKPYSIQDVDTAARLCPMLVNWEDYRAAWTTLPEGVEFVPYLGNPSMAGKGKAGKAALNQYLAPYDAMNLRVAFDSSATLGGPDAQIKAAVMAYHKKHGIVVETWINRAELKEAEGVGVVCWTAETARWRAQSGRQPPWFPLKAELKRPVWFPINDLPENWNQMNEAARNSWMARRAIDIALDGDVPFVPMAQAGCIKEFNEYFGRKR